MDLSFLQELTIGLIKRSSSQFSSFLICPSSFILLSSVLTESSKWRVTRLFLVGLVLGVRENE